MTKSRTKQKCVNSAKFYIGSDDKRSNRAYDFTPYLKNAFQTRITDITRTIAYKIDHKSASTVETKQHPRLLDNAFAYCRICKPLPQPEVGQI
jgi:hypothetical protein